MKSSFPKHNQQNWRWHCKLISLYIRIYHSLPQIDHSCIDHIIWDPNNLPYSAIVTTFQLPKPSTSLNRPFQVGPVIDRFREICTCIHIYMHTYMIHTYMHSCT